MKKLLAILIFMSISTVFAATDYDTLIKFTYPSAVSGSNYRLGKTIDGDTYIAQWTVDLSTPTLQFLQSRQPLYDASPEKAALDLKVQQLKIKLNISDSEVDTLKIILKG